MRFHLERSKFLDYRPGLAVDCCGWWQVQHGMNRKIFSTQLSPAGDSNSCPSPGQKLGTLSKELPIQ
jgi:hypothetical protein